MSEPKWASTHAISIDATPQRIWPWIAQIGQGRGGFYSYQNLAGSEITNGSRIIAEHQAVRTGDPIRLHAETPAMIAAIVEKPTVLVLYGSPADGDDGPALSTNWAFLLRTQPDRAAPFSNSLPPTPTIAAQGSWKVRSSSSPCRS